MSRLNSTYRDFLLLMTLGILVRIAMREKHPPYTNSQHDAYTTTRNHSDTATHLIHEPDEHILRHIDMLLVQTSSLLDSLDISDQQIAKIKKIKQRLLYLRRTYLHTSPGVVLLGPIGTTGIVLKEQALEKELVEIEKKLNNF